MREIVVKYGYKALGGREKFRMYFAEATPDAVIDAIVRAKVSTMLQINVAWREAPKIGALCPIPERKLLAASP